MHDRHGKPYAVGQRVLIFGRKYGRFWDETRIGVVIRTGQHAVVSLGPGATITVNERDEIIRRP